MAARPVFIPGCRPGLLVDEIYVNFPWNPGLAAIQKKRNIAALHQAAKVRDLFPLLEVSTKSDDELGQSLSAFNLTIDTEAGSMSIESAFQGSKIFELGGPYQDLYWRNSREAKKDPRIRSSGNLTGFRFLDETWSVLPRTAFYDWLYLNALRTHDDLLPALSQYKGFTDIEFNPERSVNCQARACPLLVSLLKLDGLDDALESQGVFLDMISSTKPEAR
jgi:hypothetical protein